MLMLLILRIRRMLFSLLMLLILRIKQMLYILLMLLILLIRRMLCILLMLHIRQIFTLYPTNGFDTADQADALYLVSYI